MLPEPFFIVFLFCHASENPGGLGAEPPWLLVWSVLLLTVTFLRDWAAFFCTVAAASQHFPSRDTSAVSAAAPARGWTRIILFDRFALRGGPNLLDAGTKARSKWHNELASQAKALAANGKEPMQQRKTACFFSGMMLVRVMSAQ